MDGWNISFLLGPGLFSSALAVSFRWCKTLYLVGVVGRAMIFRAQKLCFVYIIFGSEELQKTGGTQIRANNIPRKHFVRYRYRSWYIFLGEGYIDNY